MDDLFEKVAGPPEWMTASGLVMVDRVDLFPERNKVELWGYPKTVNHEFFPVKVDVFCEEPSTFEKFMSLKDQIFVVKMSDVTLSDNAPMLCTYTSNTGKNIKVIEDDISHFLDEFRLWEENSPQHNSDHADDGGPEVFEICGTVTLKMLHTKSGLEMGIGTVVSEEGEYEIYLFPDIYAKYKEIGAPDRCLVDVTNEGGDDEVRLVVHGVRPVSLIT